MTQLSILPGPESAPPDRCQCCEAHRRQSEEINTGSFRAAAQNQTRLGVQIQAQDTHAHPQAQAARSQQTDSEANKVAASTAQINSERNDHEKTRMSTTSSWQNEVYEVLESLVDVTATMVDVAQMLADAIPSAGSKFGLGLERESGLGLEHERKFRAQSKVQDQVDKTQLELKPDAEDALDDAIKRFDILIKQRKELVCREASEVSLDSGSCTSSL
ncbi:hypothetical protein CPB84DRAFT_261066 [Gymnopilus junonius]|uniref:Uncharacterized protein n=1 Tax=Gymnopilus junonius TaxID=109634 RepID=A0A9P5NFN3_GYMJU|nr:hypothetical protein CPB84DRAFT_261066 [Gymnopilus junonius]